MRLGIFAKTFAGTDPDPVLGAVRAAGYDAAQFNLACCGLPSMPDSVPADVVARISRAASRHGVSLVALSGTYNMIHPDHAVRRDGLRRLRIVLEAARALGIPLVTLCTGTRDPDDQWRHHPDNATPEAWSDLCAEMATVLDLAESVGVDVGIEPEQANVVASAGHARELIDTLDSERLRVILDPANLFEVASPARARDLVAEAIDTVGDRIALAHAKDRDAQGHFVAPGRGVVNFPEFASRLRNAGFSGAMVTHGLSAAEAPGVAAFLSSLVTSR